MAGHPEDSKINIFTGVYRHYHPAPAPGGAELDMGCGSGSFTIALAKKYPDRQILAAGKGCEVIGSREDFIELTDAFPRGLYYQTGFSDADSARSFLKAARCPL